VASGIYAIINTLEPAEIPYADPCPAALAAIRHRCYVGKAKDFERRWRSDHVPYLLNGQHACGFLLDAFQNWLRSDPVRLRLAYESPKDFKAAWLVRGTRGSNPEWNLGPFLFRVLEEVPIEGLTAREREYLAANPGGYRGSKNDAHRWRKWDGR
jgi:hypothetical protein